MLETGLFVKKRHNLEVYSLNLTQKDDEMAIARNIPHPLNSRLKRIFDDMDQYSYYENELKSYKQYGP